MRRKARSADELLRQLADGDVGAIDDAIGGSGDELPGVRLPPELAQVAEVAALTAVDASPASWFMHLSVPRPQMEVERLLGALLAVAPIVGTARVVSAAANMARVTAISDDLEDAEL